MIIIDSSLFLVGKRELRKIVPRGITEEDVRTIAGPWESLRVLEARLEASSSTFLLNVDQSPQLWPGKSTRTGIPLVIHDQVGKSASRQVGRSASLGPRKVLPEDWAGIIRVAMPASGRDGRPTHPTNCRPKIRRRFQGCG